MERYPWFLYNVLFLCSILLLVFIQKKGGKLQLTPPKLLAIFNSTSKVSIFSIDPSKVSIFFNLSTPSVKADMTNRMHVITFAFFIFFIFFLKCPHPCRDHLPSLDSGEIWPEFAGVSPVNLLKILSASLAQ
jgi:hypothetical protein